MSTRLSRLLVLQKALARRSSARIEDLEEEFGVSRRTIFRDFQTLRNAGVDVRFDASQGGHRSPEEATAMPDSRALLILLRHAAVTALPMSSAERRLTQAAADTLAEHLPVSQREQLNDFRRSIAVRTPQSDSQRYKAMLQTFEQAVDADLCLELFAGLPADTPPQLHVVQPLRLAFDITKGWRLEGLLVDSHLTCRVGLRTIPSLSLSEQPIVRRLARAKVEWTCADIEVG